MTSSNYAAAKVDGGNLDNLPLCPDRRPIELREHPMLPASILEGSYEPPELSCGLLALPQCRTRTV